MSNKTTLRQWLKNFVEGQYSAKDRQTQCDAGWFDWFCKNESLVNKTYSLAPKVAKVAKSPKVNIDTCYLLFKNNCPMYGSLYDDFRLCDLESGEVIFTVVPKCGHTAKLGQTEIWGRENDFDAPLYEGDWKGALKWFSV